MHITYAPLRRLMAERGVSFYQLRDIGVLTSSRTATRLRNDSGYVSLQTIDLLCDYFNVDPSLLIARRVD